MITLRLVFLILAVVAFLLAVFNWPPTSRVNFTALGLLLWVLATIAG
jgi:hypothetical protein